MRTDSKKIFLYRGIGAMLLAGLILWIGFWQLFRAADIVSSFPEDSCQLTSFELQNPVCSIQTAQGTEADELALPSALRVVLPLEEVHMEKFEQARPQMNSSNGDYDYYSYGYVAPRDEEELYREGKTVIYTITYAEDEENSEAGKKTEYRLYGSLDGGDNAWFVCNEAGVITGEVTEVPVVWDTNAYDGNKTGEYQIVGKISKNMEEECGQPIARVEVKDKQEMESVCVETAHVHTAPSTETESMTGTGNKTENVLENGKAGKTQDILKNGRIEETESVSGNDRAEETEDVSGNDIETEDDVSGNDVSGNDIYPDDVIEYFEEKTPVVKRKVRRGTTAENIGFPEKLKAVFFREEPEEAAEFVQMEPESEEAERAGYIAPENEAQLRKSGDRVIYTYSGKPAEVLAREILRSLAEEEEYGGVEEPEKAYRLYGALEGEEAGWYVCDENGTITGRIKSVAVTWDLSTYDAGTEGKYLIPAIPDDAYEMKGEMACAEIKVAEPVCTCIAEEYNRPWEHESFCACFEPVQCMCREDDREDHDETNRDCPLWNQDIMELYRSDGMTLTWVMLEDIRFFLENGFAIPEEFKILYGAADMSLNGGGANDVAQDNYMDAYTAVDSAKGEWINYVNTVWKNKGKNKFEWKSYITNASIWVGGVSMRQGDPEKDDFAFPKMDSSGVYFIYSPEQLRYVLLYMGDSGTAAVTVKIRIAKDINLNGSKYNWEPIIRKNTNCQLVLDGQGHTIYNLGVFTGNSKKNCVFVDCGGNGSIFRNLTFSNAKLVGWTEGSAADHYSTSLFGQTGFDEFSCITVKDSLIFGGYWVAPLFYGYNTKTIAATRTTTVKNCYTENCYVFGKGHVGGLIAMPYRVAASYSYVRDTLVVSEGGDVGGFVSCTPASLSARSDYSRCFVSNAEIYAGYAGGFVGLDTNSSGSYTDCFTSGVMRVGIRQGGGFLEAVTSNQSTATTFTRCYSTMHVLALYDSCTDLGGFAGVTTPPNMNVINRQPIKFDSCYAAGEVGSYTIDLSINNRDNNERYWGGFIGSERAVNASGELIRNATIDQYKYCYYDKQTTGMREWLSGTKKSLIENGKQSDISAFSNNGIRGVMTSGKSTSKGGAGLTDNGVSPVTGDTKGFVGFSEAYKWTRGYSSDQYPQIYELYYATGSSNKNNWKGSDGLPSDEIAQTVSNASKASVQTVKLNTWENGSNWNSYGIRSDASYEAASNTAYKGGLYTYDTVRDIVSPGTARCGYSGTWNEFISGGTRVSGVGWSSTSGGTVTINNSNKALEPKLPGVNWFEYRTSGSVNSQTGRRPIRLNCLMTMDAGTDAAVVSGQYYNHRSNGAGNSNIENRSTAYAASPAFRMANTMNDKLVLGVDNSQYWSAGTTGRYGYSIKNYYNTSPKSGGTSTIDLTTKFPTGKDSRIYTEIWRAKKDSSGNWVEDVKVAVTGYTDNNSRREQQRWNGSLPMYTDLSTGRTYIVRYYWLLKDGRYITDFRTVTVNPDTYYLTMHVRNSADSVLNSNALYVRASSGITPVFSTTTSSQSTYSNCPYTDNAVAAWRQTDNYRVTGIKLEMLDKAGTVIGSRELRNTEVKEGTQITVSYPKEYFSKGSYELSYNTTVTVTYTVKKHSDGRYYLVFNKMKNPPSDEISAAKTNKDSTGISVASSSSNTYINDMQNNVRLTLYVEPTNTLTVKKELDENARKYADKEKSFPITITLSTGANGTGTGYTGKGTYTSSGNTYTLNFQNGKASVYLKDGETATIKNIPKEYGFYSVKEDQNQAPGYNVRYLIADSGKSGISNLPSASGSFAADAGTPGTVDVTVQNNLQLAGYFQISKTVTALKTDSRIDKDQEYQIDLMISKSSDFSDKTFSGEFSYEKGTETGKVVFEGGKTTVTLKNNEKIKIKNLPPSYYFRVEEQADSAWGFDTFYSYSAGTGYLSTYSGAEGLLKYQQKVEAKVRNVEQPIPYYELPNTGGMGTYGYTTGGAAIMMTALLLLIKYRRTQKVHHG